jgi:hypothetical protein
MNLKDRFQPIHVTVKRQTTATVEKLKPPKPVLTVIAETENASIQPVSSQTLQKEAGKETQSTHELFCDLTDITTGDTVIVEYLHTTIIHNFIVAGVPDDYRTHREVRLLWQKK